MPFNKHKTKHKLAEAYIAKRTPLWKPILLLAPGLIIIFTFVMIPLSTTFNEAFMIQDDPNSYFSDRSFGLDNFQWLMGQSAFTSGFKNTLLYVMLSVPISMLISLFISAIISLFVNKYIRSSFQTIFFLPYVTSSIAIALAFISFLRIDDLLNTVLGTDIKWLSGGVDSEHTMISILIHGVWEQLAFQILLFTTAMLSVNKNLYKSASIDGASQFSQMIRITIPSIRSTINLVFILGLISGIKVNPVPLWENNTTLAIQNNGTSLLLYIYHLTLIAHNGEAAAASLILLTTSIVFSLFVRNGVALIGKGVRKVSQLNVVNKIQNW